MGRTDIKRTDDSFLRSLCQLLCRSFSLLQNIVDLWDNSLRNDPYQVSRSLGRLRCDGGKCLLSSRRQLFILTKEPGA